jgi:hypothetical protein
VKIELLYVPDCPHYPAAAKQLQAVLTAEGIHAEIQEVAVTGASMAQALQFRGSPTIRIDGRDIAGESHGPEAVGLTCRLYPDSDERGVPPLEMMRSAIREAHRRETQ